MSFLWNINIFLLPPLVSLLALGEGDDGRQGWVGGEGFYLWAFFQSSSIGNYFLYRRGQRWTHTKLSVFLNLFYPALWLQMAYSPVHHHYLKPASHLWSSVLISVVGNASPFAIRSTSYCVPCEGQAALLSCLPLGALITPLVKQSAEEVSFSLLSLLHILLKMEMKLQYCCYNQLIWHLDIRCIKCVCLLPLEATPTVQRDRVCCGLWGVWSFHVSSDGLAGLWSKVLLPLLWQTQWR